MIEWKGLQAEAFVHPAVFLVRMYSMQAMLTGIQQPVLTLSTELLRQMDGTML